MVTFDDGCVPAGDLRKISSADYKKIVKEGLKSYDREVKDMPFDFFQEVMDHLACADRARTTSLFQTSHAGYWVEDRHPVIRWSRPRTAIVKHCNDLLAQALEARGVQFRH